MKANLENVTIVLFGQPGSGKSSLINAICGYQAAPVGVETDTTREPLFVEHGDVTFIDLPGYGTPAFPWQHFLEEFQPFQYDLFLCVFSDKLHPVAYQISVTEFLLTKSHFTLSKSFIILK